MLESLIQVNGRQKEAVMRASGYVVGDAVLPQRPVTTDKDRPEEPQENSVTETVLVVEDETMLRNLVSKGLRMHHYQVLCAADGLQALEVVQRHAGRIDALITDLMMPHIGGTELARRLTAIRPQLKVLFMSGCVPTEFDAAALLTPGMEFLPKPFTLDQLWRKLQEMLEYKK